MQSHWRISEGLFECGMRRSRPIKAYAHYDMYANAHAMQELLKRSLMQYARPKQTISITPVNSCQCVKHLGRPTKSQHVSLH
jgi:hypothetical protein